MPTIGFAATMLPVGGLSAFVWGYLLATVLLHRATFAITSVPHVWGANRQAA